MCANLKSVFLRTRFAVGINFLLEFSAHNLLHFYGSNISAAWKCVRRGAWDAFEFYRAGGTTIIHCTNC